MIDTDDNGTIDQKEFNKFLSNLDGFASNKQLRKKKIQAETWKMFDIDGDGEITYEEFYSRAAGLRRAPDKKNRV